eukprot:768640-Hanusia_phi.AAC.9
MLPHAQEEAAASMSPPPERPPSSPFLPSSSPSSLQIPVSISHSPFARQGRSALRRRYGRLLVAIASSLFLLPNALSSAPCLFFLQARSPLPALMQFDSCLSLNNKLETLSLRGGGSNGARVSRNGATMSFVPSNGAKPDKAVKGSDPAVINADKACNKNVTLNVDMHKIEALRKLGASLRIGGPGTSRRKFKNVRAMSDKAEDAMFQGTLRKLGINQVPDIKEVQFIKEDGTCMVFSNPRVLANVGSNTFVFQGAYEEARPQVFTEQIAKMIERNGIDVERLRQIASDAIGSNLATPEDSENMKQANNGVAQQKAESSEQNDENQDDNGGAAEVKPDPAIAPTAEADKSQDSPAEEENVAAADGEEGKQQVERRLDRKSTRGRYLRYMRNAIKCEESPMCLPSQGAEQT